MTETEEPKLVATDREWEYSNYRATLMHNGQPFALVAEAEVKMPAISKEKQDILLNALNPRPAGKIHPKHTMFLRKHIGECKDDDGSEYELLVHTDNTPLIMSKQTGKYFTMPFEDIVRMAIAAGIDIPDQEVESV